MELDFPGEAYGLSCYFAPAFAAGYAALLADLQGPEVAESAARLFAAHAFCDTYAHGISPCCWRPWPQSFILEHALRTTAWGGSHPN